MSSIARRRIGYLLAYKQTDYVRSRSLVRALEQMDDVDLVPMVANREGIGRYAQALRLLRSESEKSSLDALIVGFRGYEIFWPAKWVVGRDVPIILDAMMSPYGALVEERKFGFPGRIAAIPWYRIERSTLRAADHVLTDTPAHRSYLARLHQIPEDKIADIPIGADECVVADQPGQVGRDNKFTVLFYGSFLPLHGVDVILQAVSRLRGQPILFEFVGGGRREARQIASACERAGIEYSHQKWIEYKTLVSAVIPRADLCLGGPFGNTPQARRVVTGKASQSLALGKATIVGLPVPVSGFVDRKNCLLVPQGDPEALAEQVQWALSNREKLRSIGIEGRNLYQQQLSIDVIRHRLKGVLDKVLP